MFFRRIKVENLEKLLGTIQEQSFTFNYGDNKAEINLDTLLSDYDDGTSFIDYLSDFYYVQSVYQKSKKHEKAEPVDFFQEFSNSNESYYKLLSLIKFYYSELESCLNEIHGDARFRYHMYSHTYRELFYASYSYIKINWPPYLDKDDNDVYLSIDVKSNFEEKNKILSYFIKKSFGELHTFKKLILLAIILELLITNEAVIRIRFLNIEELFESFSKKISHLTRLFQSSLSSHLSSDKLCLVSTATNDWFGEMISDKNFSTEIDKLSRNNREKLNCYAIAYGDDFYYYAINHMDGKDRQNLHDIFSNFLKNIPAARLTDQVRYFLPDEKNFINYGEFQNFPDKPVGKFNRMFTCCERKIFAKLRTDKPADKYVYIIVTQAPCPYCSRELRYIKDNKTLTIDINYPESSNINSYDSLAHEIFDSCLRHTGSTDIKI